MTWSSNIIASVAVHFTIVVFLLAPRWGLIAEGCSACRLWRQTSVACISISVHAYCKPMDTAPLDAFQASDIQ